MKPNEDQLPPILRELQQKGDGYQTPSADYFSKLADKIVAEEQKQPRQAVVRRLQVRRWLAYAAALALVLTAAWQFRPATTDVGAATASNATITIDDLDDDEILDYIDDNLSDFDLELLAEDVELN